MNDQVNSIVITITTLLLLFNTTLSLAVNSDSYNMRYAVPDKQIYTLQVGSFPDSSVEAAETLFKRMKTTGVPVYLLLAGISERGDWIRVRVGVFDSLAQAELFKTQYDSLLPPDALIMQDVLLVRENGDDAVITTPNAIWVKMHGQYNECFQYNDVILYPTRKTRYATNFAQPFFTPDQNHIVFEYDDKIYLINIESGIIKTIEIKPNTDRGEYRGMGNSVPQMSPSGRYIGFIDGNLWESSSSLWLYDVTRDSVFKIINQANQNAVKNFRWHPNKDIIFYVFGYSTGTVSVGGDIYATDMEGNHVKLIEHDKDKHQEITIDIVIHDGYLHYKIAQFDSGYAKIESIVDKKVRLDELVSGFETREKDKTNNPPRPKR